jgi:hypothetical protein
MHPANLVEHEVVANERYDQAHLRASRKLVAGIFQ